jgi:hypothetical protein
MLLSALAAGCARTVIQTGPGDPLWGARHFAVEGVDYSNFLVGRKPEFEYLARKDEKQRQSWQTDKAETAQLFFGELVNQAGPLGLDIQPAPPPGPGYFVIRPVVTFIEPGNFNYFANINTQVQMRLVIFDDQGRQVDNIPFVAYSAATLSNPSSGGRIREAGARLGREAARYLTRRTGISP